MPAYIRLLAYFSNFILLASFLGIGIGCLLANARSRLFAWFPVLTAAVVGAVYFFRLEVAIPPSPSRSSPSRRRSSCRCSSSPSRR